jgi:hypothetical protein
MSWATAHPTDHDRSGTWLGSFAGEVRTLGTIADQELLTGGSRWSGPSGTDTRWSGSAAG